MYYYYNNYYLLPLLKPANNSVLKNLYLKSLHALALFIFFKCYPVSRVGLGISHCYEYCRICFIIN